MRKALKDRGFLVYMAFIGGVMVTAVYILFAA